MGQWVNGNREYTDHATRDRLKLKTCTPTAYKNGYPRSVCDRKVCLAHCLLHTCASSSKLDFRAEQGLSLQLDLFQANR